MLPKRIALGGKYGYEAAASAAGYLQMVDVSGAGGPRLIAQLQLASGGSEVTDRLVGADLGYAVHARGVVAVDVVDPTNPKVAGRWAALEGEVLSGALGEGDLFLVHSAHGHIVLRSSLAPEPTATATASPSLTPTPHPAATSTAEPTPLGALPVHIPWVIGR